ncbi:MAG: type II secretion system F family protein [Rhodoglobus sp.]|nr:type II secretion system F family protein [Rhodoglobus sp.]
MTAKPRDTLSDVAVVTQRLAVLLGAGVAPVSAWQHLAVGSSSPVVLAAAGVESAHIPDTIAEAAATLPPLEAGAWRGLAAAWSIATDAGASLAPSLTSYAQSLRSLAQTQRDVAVALAGPVATARIVMVLPVVGVLFGLALGFDTVGTLLTTTPGWVCLASGGLGLFAAHRWNSRLVGSARPTDATPGLDFDLAAIAVGGGGSLDRAMAAVRVAGEEFGILVGDLDEVLDLSRRAGVPAGELLRTEAEEARRTARSGAQERAAALGVKLMLPLGLCVLPAFMALGVAPLLITVISSTVGSF